MNGFIVSSRAKRHLLEIWSFIALDDEKAADRVENEFYAAFASLARMPGLGSLRPALTPKPLLFFVLRSYLIVYRRVKVGIQIVAVVHGRRDLKVVLKQEHVT